MPFPLAHPAAVLPFKRYCPRFLDFPALIIGSMTPDLGYAVGVGDVSHEFVAGTVKFDLPVGMLVVALFYLLRFKLLLFLPAAPRSALLPACRRRVGSVLVIFISLLAGIWTHLLLDSICHWDGFIATHVAFLQHSLPIGIHHHVRVYQLCYMICTFLGVVWLSWEYVNWLNNACGFATRKRQFAARVWAIVLGAIVLSVARYARGAATPLGVALSGAVIGAALVGFIYATGSWCKRTPGRT